MPPLSAVFGRGMNPGMSPDRMHGIRWASMTVLVGSLAIALSAGEQRLVVYPAVIFLTAIGIGLHRREDFPVLVHVQIIFGLAVALVTAACTGGGHSIVLAALLIYPVYAGYALGISVALKYGGVVIGLMLGLYGFDAAGVVFTNILPPADEPIFALAMALAMLAMLVGVTAALLHSQRRAEQQLAANDRELGLARDLAQAATRAKTEFLANVGHEIRSPMTGVIGMSELLLDTPLNAAQRDYAESVRDHAQALLTVMNDVVDFSKVESGKLQLELLDMDLRDTVEDVARLLSIQAHEKGLEITVLVDPDLPEFVRGDAGRIRQILLSLGANAIQYTQRGEISMELKILERIGTVSSIEGVTCIRFEVRDTGIGMSAERRAALFAPFQMEASTTRNFGGAGLGLSIARRLVELMGGESGAESEPGRGSTFWFTVPFALVECAKASAYPSQSVLNRQRLLLVDDNPTNRRVLLGQLLRCGVDPICAGSAAEGLAIMREARAGGRPFEVALLDQQMPDCDGAELGRRIVRDEELATTRLILLTSSGQRGDGQLFADIGFAGYLLKPVAQRDLIECLKLVLAQSAEMWRSQALPIVTRHQLRAQRARGKNHVLLAEDNVLNQKVAVRLLEKLGYRVDVVADGWTAIKEWQSGRYGLIFMDCQLPELDGCEAAAEIRRREAGAEHVPIVALMERGMQDPQQTCLDAGMDEFLFKPIARNLLQACLERHLGAPLPESAGLEARGLEGPAASPELPVDWTSLTALAGDGEFARELAAHFIETGRHSLDLIGEALAHGNSESLSKSAHEIRAASASMQARGTTVAAERLEMAAKAGNADQLAGLMQHLRCEFEIAADFLQSKVA
jgi:signal transduction histidine kinase/CheY-like chemotaxis protein/HPt (histidine-containing phosphotransfer) domain-containing protein